MRTVLLMALRDDHDFIVMASQGGVDREPHRRLNLQADPRAEVAFRGRRMPVNALVRLRPHRENRGARVQPPPG